jgi:hypothetical protein
VRCKANDELQIQLVGYEASGLETTLNQWRPAASSSDTRIASAEVPAHTGQQVRVHCLADGKAKITVAFRQVSTNVSVQVGDGGSTQPQSDPASPEEKDGASARSTLGWEIVQNSKPFDSTLGPPTVIANCPAGKKVLGGGAEVQLLSGSEYGTGLLSSAPTPDGSGWTAKPKAISGAPKNASFRLLVYAICATVQ